MSKIESYTAANNFPIKILMNPQLSNNIINRHIVPAWHLQLNPTNKCSFNCSFCSCANRNRTSEICFEDLTRFIDGKNCFSATITGGGEPTFYSHINELVELLKRNRCDIGLVSNGSNIQSLTKKTLNALTWCRISCSDELPEQTNIVKWFRKLEEIVISGVKVDWAFSYVLSGEKINFELLNAIIDFANTHKFTHVRVVSNLLKLSTAISMPFLIRAFEHFNTDYNRVIFQGRKQFVRGQKRCYISLLKPVISAEGQLYPCCGVQYALKNPSLDYEKSMCMGSMEDLPELIEKQQFFDGSKCIRCYYSEYNQFIKLMLSKLDHVRFV